ncbi:MAG: cation transporter [Alcaligenaceae bacterium]|nr:cation transporter [Alcaligenaceae bacterium]
MSPLPHPHKTHQEPSSHHHNPKKPGATLDQTKERVRVARISTWVSVGVNFTLSILQIIIGIIAQSQALIADAVHTLSDLVSDFAVLFASKHANKGPDESHQFGHQRFETLAALGIGILLLLVGVEMIWAAAVSVQSGQSIAPVHYSALIIALATLIGKELLFRYLLKQAEKVRSSMLVANAWHSRSDAASSLIVAIGIIANMAGLTWADPIAALIVGLMVSRMGLKFIWSTLNDLTDRSVDNETYQRIHEKMAGTPGLLGIHDLKTRKMGDMILVEVHLELPASMTIAEGHAISDELCRRAMEDEDILDITTHFDPR